MNRRSFLKSLAASVLTAAATIYSPELLRPAAVEMVTVTVAWHDPAGKCVHLSRRELPLTTWRKLEQPDELGYWLRTSSGGFVTVDTSAGEVPT